MKMQDIRLRAKAMGINSFGKSKGDLIREIQRSEGNFDCFGSATEYCDQTECCFRSDCIQENKKPARKGNKLSVLTQVS